MATTVTERGLVTEKAKWKDIVTNHHFFSTTHKHIKHFAGLSLAYVTPVSGPTIIIYTHMYVHTHMCSGITMVTTLPSGSVQSSPTSRQSGFKYESIYIIAIPLPLKLM